MSRATTTYPVRGGDPDDLRDRLLPVKTPVAADDEGAAGQLVAQGVQRRLDEVLRVMLLLEDPDGLPQTGSAGLLAVVYPGVHHRDARRRRRRRRGHDSTHVAVASTLLLLQSRSRETTCDKRWPATRLNPRFAIVARARQTGTELS